MRASRKDCDNVTASIEAIAKDMGLLPAAATLSYVPGKGSYTPEVRSYNDDGYTLRHVSFLPEFQRGYKTTMTEAYLMLRATDIALRAAAGQLKGLQ
ncbi:MAG TPA: hypothetical protein DEP82_14900 [Arthrobacter bacterium]|jgi:hypothetical protein|nr:hypothetical protein [Arthrobacter sp.]